MFKPNSQKTATPLGLRLSQNLQGISQGNISSLSIGSSDLNKSNIKKIEKIEKEKERGIGIGIEKKRETVYSEIKKNISKQQASFERTEVNELTFSLFSEKEIDKLAVLECDNPDPGFESGDTNTSSTAGTIRDLKLGPRETGQTCLTCGLDMYNCIGHFGKIKIPEIFHPLLVSAIIKCLEIFCPNCSGLL